MDSISPLPFAGFDQLANLALHQIPLQAADVADIELAIQMIGLVQEGAGQQVFPGLLIPLAMRILRTNRNFLGAGYGFTKLGNAEASLRLTVLPFLMKNFWVRQHQFGVCILFESYVDDGEPLGDADLWCSQADSTGLVHGLEHVVDEFAQL